ncbi:MAG: hypothetical protein ACRCU2_04200 [Planktothrix sp.]
MFDWDEELGLSSSVDDQFDNSSGFGVGVGVGVGNRELTQHTEVQKSLLSLSKLLNISPHSLQCL